MSASESVSTGRLVTGTISHPRRYLGVNMSLRRLLVDVHTHVYLPRYASVLRSRSIAPRILTRNTPSGQSEDRLLILDDEPSGGRPVGPQVRRSTLSDSKDCVR